MNQALKESRAELAHYDLNRDLYERRDRIHHLTRIGMSEEEVAAVLGIADRTVARHKLKPAAPQRPRLYSPDIASDDQVLRLEQTAEFALEMAQVLRDEDPCLVWGALTRLDRRRLQELAVIALAAIPVDQTRDELLGWVSNLPAAKGEA